MAPKSMPYWNGLIETRVHARMHFQFSSKPFVAAGMLVVGRSPTARDDVSVQPGVWLAVAQEAEDEEQTRVN